MVDTIATARHKFPFFVLVSALLLLAAGVIVLLQPFMRLPLALLLSGYFVLLLRHPRAVLLLLPAVVLNLDLTPWSGWALLSEFDAFMLISAAGVGLSRAGRSQVSVTPLDRRGRWWLMAWAGCWLLAVVNGVNGVGWLQPFNLVPAEVYYFNQSFQLSQLKGPLYAGLLWLLWRKLQADDPQATQRALFAGAVGGALLLAAAIGWERGIWNSLLADGPYYQRLSALLDFTSGYRITGLLSSMHTGGETIDGALILLLALSTAAALFSPSRLRRVALPAALAMVYCVLVTFTRTTYLALIMVVLVAAGLLWLSHARRMESRAAEWPSATAWLLFAGGALAIVALSVLVFRLSGYLGVLAVYLMLAIAAAQSLFHWLRALNRWWLALLYAGAIAFGLYAQLTSKWVQPGPGELLQLLLSLTLIAGLAHALGRNLRLERAAVVTLLAAIAVLSFVALVLFGSYRMGDRLARVSTDLDSRLQHWSDVLTAKPAGARSWLLGSGPGSYPRAYAIAHPDKVRTVGSFRIMADGIHLGFGRDLKLAQRVAIRPHHEYRISIRYSAQEPSGLSFGFCERNQLFGNDVTPVCAEKSVKLEPATEGEMQLEINSGRVGERGALARWPTVFYLFNRWPTELTLHAVQVSEDRHELLRNGNFESTRRWYFYNDFEHLPWHMKNLPLALLFELGLLGLLVSLGVTGLALRRALCAAAGGDALAAGVALALVGMLVLGLAGNPLDSERVATLFYWLLLIGVGFSPGSRRSAGPAQPVAAPRSY